MKSIDDIVKTPWYDSYNNMRKHIDYPNTSLYNIILNHSINHPDVLAYIYFNTTCTYKEFIRRIDRVAKAFSELGVKKGDRVSICLPNVPEALISFYAINKIGAVANMIHPLSSEMQIKSYCNMAEAEILVILDVAYNKFKKQLPLTQIKKTVIVSAGTSMDPLTKVGYWFKQGRKVERIKRRENVIFWYDFIKLGKSSIADIKPTTTAEDPAVILYSGGTTGKPKGVLHNNLSLIAGAISQIEVLQSNWPNGMPIAQRILAIMPVFHGYGLGSTIHAGLTTCGTCILIPSLDPRKFDKVIAKYKPNGILGIPSLYETLLSTKEDFDFSDLKFVISGGDVLPADLEKRINKFLEEHNSPVDIAPAYGLSECLSGVTVSPAKGSKVGSVGIPCPDTYVKIVNPDTCEELPYGTIGEICVHSPLAMTEYINDYDETKKTKRIHKDGLEWVHTGDLAYMDEDGFIFFEQRLKRMIISSGYNIAPQYIEKVIDSHPDVHRSIVVGVPHKYKIEVAKAFIVLKDDVKNESKAKKEIRELCRQNIEEYAQPYEFVYCDSLPISLMGKVDYRELIKQEQNKDNKN